MLQSEDMNICPVGIFDYSLVLVTLQTHYCTAVTGGHCQYCYITEAYANMICYAKTIFKKKTLHFSSRFIIKLGVCVYYLGNVILSVYRVSCILYLIRY